MAQKNGLGRGLSSLIPNKTASTDNTSPQGRGGAKDAWGRSKELHETIMDKKLPPSPARDEVRAPHDAPAEEVTTSRDTPKKKELAVIGVPVGKIIENTQQPRHYFDYEKLDELAASIKEHGILQPLVVVHSGDGYELISGERRLRAAKKAGLAKVPVIVRGRMDEQKKLELALIENIQRHDLNVIEEAKSYKKLADEFNLTQEEIAQKAGKSRSLVANRMRLANLPVSVQRALIEGQITEGHAKVILSLDNPEKQRALYDLIHTQKLTVRDAEREAQSVGSSRATGGEGGAVVRAHTRRTSQTPEEKLLTEQLATYFGTKVDVRTKGAGGTITVHFYSDDEKKNILGKLKLSE